MTEAKEFGRNNGFKYEVFVAQGLGASLNGVHEVYDIELPDKLIEIKGSKN